MSFELVERAQRLTDLPAKTQLVYIAMCDKTDHRQGGFFFKDLDQFRREDAPFVASATALRNHLQILRSRGYIQTAKRGTGGLGAGSIKKRSMYYIDAPGISPPLPDDPQQLKLRLFTLLTPYDTNPNLYATDKDQPSASGTRESVSGIADTEQQSESRASESVSVLPDKDQPSASGTRESVSGIADTERQSESRASESVSVLPDTHGKSMSEEPDIDRRVSLLETEGTQTEGQPLAYAAAAESVSDFFYDVSTACGEIGIHGVTPFDFAELESLVSQCPRELTLRDAQWVADEVKIANQRSPVRSVKFVVSIAKQVVMGSGGNFYIDASNTKTHGTHGPPVSESVPASNESKEPYDRRAGAPDWQTLHQWHGAELPASQRSRTQAPGQVWDAALGELQLQVARPAFETWLRDTDGIGRTENEFFVGVANQFASEMLESRLYPPIQRALEKVIGATVDVRFVLMYGSNGSIEDCPLCVEELTHEETA